MFKLHVINQSREWNQLQSSNKSCCIRKVEIVDLVSYRGPRSIVMVDMSVDSRSTDGRYLGRASVDNWG